MMLCDAHLHSSHSPRAELSEGGLYLSCAGSQKDWQPLLETGGIIPFLGIHPQMINPGWEAEMERLDRILAAHPRAGLGECGLDRRFYSSRPREEQETVLKSHFDLARKHGRALVLHQVRAPGRLADFLHREKPETPVMIHGFTGSLEILDRYLKQDIYISLGPGQQWNKPGFPDLVQQIPRNRLLLETDWPYSAGGRETQYTECLNHFYEMVSRQIGIDKESLAGIVRENGEIFTH